MIWASTKTPHKKFHEAFFSLIMLSYSCALFCLALVHCVKCILRCIEQFFRIQFSLLQSLKYVFGLMSGTGHFIEEWFAVAKMDPVCHVNLLELFCLFLFPLRWTLGLSSSYWVVRDLS